jgi:hypothetical protein
VGYANIVAVNPAAGLKTLTSFDIIIVMRQYLLKTQVRLFLVILLFVMIIFRTLQTRATEGSQPGSPTFHQSVFIKKDMPIVQVTLTDCGGPVPVYSNETAEGRKHNRWMETLFTRE